MDLRVLGLVLVATALLAGCGESQDTVVLDNGNDNTIRTTTTPFAGTTPTAVPTPQRTATDVPGTATPAPDGTETPGPGATETEAGPSGTPGPGATRTPTPGLTGSPTPGPTSTAAGPFCGNGVKEAGEDCDSGTVFSSNADCAEQCACCLCRPDSIHAAVPMTKCTTCHPPGSVASTPLTFPPGAAQTFPGLCE